MIEITADELKAHRDKYILVDVREPHELLGPEGYIEGAILTPLGPILLQFLESADYSKEYVFLCRSGYRSGQACDIAHAYGFSKTYNLRGGILEWKKKGF